MPDQKLTIIIPEDETVEETVEVVQAWLGRGSDEWRTVASLLLSDVEAATVAKNLIDRTAT